LCVDLQFRQFKYPPLGSISPFPEECRQHDTGLNWESCKILGLKVQVRNMLQLVVQFDFKQEDTDLQR